MRGIAVDFGERVKGEDGCGIATSMFQLVSWFASSSVLMRQQ